MIIQDEVEDLISNYSEIEDANEKRKQIEELLDFTNHLPPEVPELSQQYVNPAIDGYLETHEYNTEDGGWTPVTDTTPIGTYQKFIPTDEAIETLCSLSPIIEIGSGNGYYSYMINENGGSCLATDSNPARFWMGSNTQFSQMDEFPFELVTSYGENNGEEWREQIILWDYVHRLTHKSVQMYPNRTVLLCHPPTDKWPQELLDMMNTGDTFVFIGEWYPGVDASPLFFYKLLTEWEEIDSFPIYNWASTHAYGFVFEKM